MFKDRSFNLAFLISLSWHLFLIFFVTIIVVPPTFKKAKIYTVSFLGPILEKTAFEFMLEPRASKRQALFEQPESPRSDFSAYTEEKTEKMKFDMLVSGANTAEAGREAGDRLGDFKVLPSLQDIGSGAGREGKEAAPLSRPENKDLLIEGQAAGREILFKPEMPSLPKRIGQTGGSFTVELKFEVLSDGGVNEVSLLASSGYPDVDLAAMNYIRGFRFAPMDPGRSGPERGKVRLNLKGR